MPECGSASTCPARPACPQPTARLWLWDPDGHSDSSPLRVRLGDIGTCSCEAVCRSHRTRLERTPLLFLSSLSLDDFPHNEKASVKSVSRGF